MTKGGPGRECNGNKDKLFSQTHIEFKSSLSSQVSVRVLTFCCTVAGITCTFFLPSLPFSPSRSSFLSLTCSSAGGHPLCLRCLTMEIWRPKLRWTEQHSSQIRTPRLILVQPGSGRQTEISRFNKYLHCPPSPPNPLFSAVNQQNEVEYVNVQKHKKLGSFNKTATNFKIS